MQFWTGSAAVLAVVAATGAFADPQPYGKTIKVKVDEDKPLMASDVDINYGGFVKMDALFTVYSDGDVPTTGGIRDYYSPNSIPVAGTPAAENSTNTFDFSAKETRFFFKIDAHVADTKLGGYVEMDFLTSPGAGTEAVTNAYNPGLRRAFITYNNFLFGQEWSTFQGMQSLPDSLDYIRWPSEGTVFSRQAQVRYTLPGVLGGDFQFALENSETVVRPKAGTVSGGTPVTATFVTGDSQLPDLVVRYNWKASFGELDLAVLARQLRADLAATGGDAPNNTANGTATGVGASLSGKLASFGKDDVRFMVTGGDGIGRYVALAAAPDAVVDANNGLDTIKVLSGFVSYRHPWTDRWRSNLMVGTFQANNDTALMGTGVVKTITSGRINVLYSPVEKLTFGAEFTHAIRKLESGEDGNMDRLQFSAMYAY
jgi:hypothetical protein